jgi:hypothetical protein
VRKVHANTRACHQFAAPKPRRGTPSGACQTLWRHGSGHGTWCICTRSRRPSHSPRACTRACCTTVSDMSIGPASVPLTCKWQPGIGWLLCGRSPHRPRRPCRSPTTPQLAVTMTKQALAVAVCLAAATMLAGVAQGRAIQSSKPLSCYTQVRAWLPAAWESDHVRGAERGRGRKRGPVGAIPCRCDCAAPTVLWHHVRARDHL